MLKRIFSFSNLTLLVALILSTIAAWYSIIGLTTIFAGAIVPIVIMGSALELAKITTTVWLRKYWHRAGFLLKLYLVPAVMAIALITSMGIFGFLSKAHIDQGITSGDIQGKISIYDEKIKTARENIEANRKQLKQMDEAVDQVMVRSKDEKGADKAVSLRRTQSRDRNALAKDIEANQKQIAILNDEAAPLRAEVRKVEAEVGPIKYIAALIYGDNPDQNILEKAVRWMIILLVIVFDPLALMLVIAANQSKVWDKEKVETESTEPKYEPDDGALTDSQIEQIKETVAENQFDIKKHPYLFAPRGNSTPPGIDPVGPQVSKVQSSDPTLDPCYKCGTTLINATGIGPFCPNKECDVIDGPFEEEPVEITYIPPVTQPVLIDEPEIATDGVTKENPVTELEGGYVVFEGKHMHKDVLKDMRPDVLKLVADNARASHSSFGSEFPKIATRGDTFVRVDVLPNRVYKFDGTRWIIVNKDLTTSYATDESYLKYVLTKIEQGEYDVDMLSDQERQQLEEYLTKKS